MGPGRGPALTVSPLWSPTSSITSCSPALFCFPRTLRVPWDRYSGFITDHPQIVHVPTRVGRSFFFFSIFQKLVGKNGM